jgi:nickel and cobalt resistance protein CnrR
VEKTTTRFISAIAGAGLIGAVAAIGVIAVSHSLRPSSPDLHHLLHEAVPLNPDEQARLKASETQYEIRRQAIEARMKVANGQLAAAIKANPGWSPQAEAATKEVEAAAAALQRATLEHVFEMRSGLDGRHRAAYDQVLVEALERGAR